MKKKLFVFLLALLVFGVTAGAYAVKAGRDTSNAKASCCDTDCCKNHDKDAGQTAATGDSCCGMENCCKDGHCAMGGDCCKGHDDNCPMKNKTASAEQSTDMSQVVVMGSDADCCKHGADCCKGGSCCHHNQN